MRVNSKCAHQVRPPRTRQRLGSRPGPAPTRWGCGTDRKGLVDRLRISEGQCWAGPGMQVVLTTILRRSTLPKKLPWSVRTHSSTSWPWSSN